MNDTKTKHAGAGLSWRFAVLVFALIFVVIFGIQNADTVTIQFFRMEGEVSLALVLFMVLFLGVITTMIMNLPVYFKRRRMKKSYEKEISELKDKLARGKS